MSDIYRCERARGFDRLEEDELNGPKRHRNRTRGLAIVYFHMPSESDPLIYRTDCRRSGLGEATTSFYRHLEHPETNESGKDAEVLICSEARALITTHVKDVFEKKQPYPARITVDVLTNRGTCNRCAFVLQQLSRDIYGLFGGAEIRVNALWLRDGPNHECSAHPGRQDRTTGEYQSTYGSFSGEPLHFSWPPQGPSKVYKYYKDSFYHDETEHRQGVVQDWHRGGGILESDSDYEA